jgi:hypothetical protein
MKMKKIVSVLLIALFVGNNLHAQTVETLTNVTIIKMVKAKLSDDIIIDEINSSNVNFDLSDASINTLKSENVSDNVIKAMQTAVNIQTPTAEKENVSPVVAVVPVAVLATQPAIAAQATNVPVQAKDTLTQAQQNTELTSTQTPVTTAAVAVSESQKQPTHEALNTGNSAGLGLLIESARAESGTTIVIERPAFSIAALSYVNPVTDLIAFYNKEFNSLADAIREWDRKTRASLEKERQNTEAINETEKELTDKKNASAKPFTKEIKDLNTTLLKSWVKQKSIKTDMINEEKALIEELKKRSNETQSAIDAKFKEVSKNVKSANSNPSLGETEKTINIPRQKFSSKVTNHFAPVTMILVYYQNEIISLQDIITAWNEKALYLIQKDAELKKQSDPLESELSQYLATTKQNQKLKKQEISDLKKQYDSIEKERKQLAKQMGTDSDKLANDLNKMKIEVQSVVKERFTDIIDNVLHLYQYKFNL